MTSFNYYDPRLPNSYNQLKKESGQRRSRDGEKEEPQQNDDRTKLHPFSEISIVVVKDGGKNNHTASIKKVTDGIFIDAERDRIIAANQQHHHHNDQNEESSDSSSHYNYDAHTAHQQARILFPAAVRFAEKIFSKPPKNEDQDDSNEIFFNFTKARLEIISDIAETLKNDPIAAAEAAKQEQKRNNNDVTNNSSSTVNPFSTIKLMNSSASSLASTAKHNYQSSQQSVVVLPSKQSQIDAQNVLDEMRRIQMIKKAMIRNNLQNYDEKKNGDDDEKNKNNNKGFGFSGRGRRLMVLMGYKEGEALNEGGLKRPLRVLKGGSLTSSGDNNNNNKGKSVMMSNQLMFQ